MLLDDAGATFVTRPSIPQSGHGSTSEGADSVVAMRMVGSRPASLITGESLLPGVSNFVVGDDPRGWREGVPRFASVRYADVYPHTDLVFGAADGGPEYDFVLDPGADPRAVRFRFDGAAHPRVDQRGDLVLDVDDTTLRQLAPRISEERDGNARPVVGGFTVSPAGEVGFWVGPHDRASRLVIDPTYAISYASYFGGTSEDSGHSVAVDPSGDIYVTGVTISSNLPHTMGTYRGPTPHGSGSDCSSASCGDAFVAKFDPTKTGAASLVYATYFGGTGGELVANIGVDSANGRAYIGGTTSSGDLPTVGALQQSLNLGRAPCTQQGTPTDAFVAGFGSSGAVVFSSYLGGSCWDQGEGLAVDSQHDRIVLTGWTESADFPVTPSAAQTLYQGSGSCALAYNNECQDAFLAVIALGPTGGSLVYSTFLGGNGTDAGFAVAVDVNGLAYVTGETDPCATTPLPTTPGVYQRTVTCQRSGQLSAFVAEVNPALAGPASIAASTYLAGSLGFPTSGTDIAVDATGHVDVLAGQAIDVAAPAGFLTGPTAQDLFAQLGPGLTTLDYATHLDSSTTAGSGCVGNPQIATILTLPDRCLALAVDAAGRTYITGWAAAGGIPVTPGALQSSTSSPSTPDAFLEVVDPHLAGAQSLLYATYVGGSGGDAGWGVAVDRTGDVFMTGTTTSTDFPVSVGADQPAIAGARSRCLITGGTGPCPDAFVVELSPASTGGRPAPPVVTAVTPRSGPIAGGTSVTVSGTDLGGATAVLFGTAPAARISPVSGSTILAVTPAHAAATVDVTVTTPGGSSAASLDDQFTFTGAPTGGLSGGGTTNTGGSGNPTSKQPPTTGSGGSSGLPAKPLPSGAHTLPVHQLPGGASAAQLPAGAGLPVGHGLPVGQAPGQSAGQGGGPSLPGTVGGAASSGHSLPGGAPNSGGLHGVASGRGIALPGPGPRPRPEPGRGLAPLGAGGADGALDGSPVPTRFEMSGDTSSMDDVFGAAGVASLLVLAGCLYVRRRTMSHAAAAAARLRHGRWHR